jgi:primosomal protein N' (replication factor Y)
VLPILRTARFDRPLSYSIPAGLELETGDVVRIPLGQRDAYGYVLGVEQPEAAGGLRPIEAKASQTPGFSAEALELARWIAQRYACSLREAIACVAFSASVPRVIERFELERRDPPSLPSVPPRLVRLIWEDFSDGFGLEALLRHPEARRAGDRAQLLQALGALTRAGAIARKRTFAGSRLRESTEIWLEAGDAPVAGKRAAALLDLLRREGPLRRSDAVLAGFRPPIIARAVAAGAVRVAERPAAYRPTHATEAEHRFTATPEQRVAIDRIAAALDAGGYAEFLLQGVTGSGKTFVYIEAIRRVLAAGGRAIVLVPEISLTPQTARRFESVFAEKVAVLHSALSERERLDAWNAARDGTIDVVVGARSAVFAPLANLRLLVVDEAHERSYKQENAPRFHAVSVARRRMQIAGGTLLLGSATPSLESYEAALRGAIEHLHLPGRATAAPMPATTVIDMAAEFGRGNRRIFSTALTEALGERLRRGEKTVLFVNRRGSAGFMLCRACGFVPECARCDVSLVVHRGEGLLRCHLCDAQRPVPVRCEACGSTAFKEFGAGTERVAEEVARLFPQARAVRMDSDTTTRIGSHARLLDEFGAAGDILIGTQMVAKGLDFPEVTLVGAVAADIGLHLPDFRAAERTFDVLSQVIGRSGRNRAGAAIVQTYSPAHHAIACAAAHDYDGFARQELAARRSLHYPPFGELGYLGVIGRGRAAVEAAAAELGETLRRRDEVEVLGPAPYPVPRVNGEWRYRLVLKGPPGQRLADAAGEIARNFGGNREGVRLTLDLEP